MERMGIRGMVFCLLDSLLKFVLFHLESTCEFPNVVDGFPNS